MTYKPLSNRAFSLWAFIAGLEGLIALFFITSEASEAESAVAFGLSIQRLSIAFSVLFLAVFFIAIAVFHFNHSLSWNDLINKKPESIRYGLAGALILELIVLHLLFLIPAYYSPRLSAYLLRLSPVLAWLALVFAQTLIVLAYFGGVSLESLKTWRGKGPILVVFIIVGLIWGLIAITKIGLIPDELYWNVAGVPVLAGQIWIAIGVTLLVWFLYERFVTGRNRTQVFSFVIFILIWVLAAIIWIKTPLRPTFNAPGPYPPSRGFYPFVDAALFDLGAQSAIYGKGLFFGSFIDRGLLSGFLALIHRIFGQNYLVVVGVQCAVFAVFPALLYLLGEKLHSKSAGIMAATLAILKVSVAITGGKVLSTSHPKLMLTEFPTGIILVLISIFLGLWLLSSNSKSYYLAGVGASIGVGILLRANVFFMFPVFIILGLFIWKLNWRGAFRDILLVIVAFFITISPWMWRNQQVAGEPLFFLRSFNRVIEERYQPESYHGPNRFAAISLPKAPKTHPTISVTKNENALDLEKYQFIPKHFVNNLITSVLVLPPSPILDDFRHVIENYPYWGRMQNVSAGDISLSMGVFLAGNLIVFSIGIGTTWKRVKYPALVPLMVFLFYSLANAFARTSGGRYIVPVDWVVYFYYALGLVEVIRFCLSAIGFQTNGFFEIFVDQRADNGSAKLNWRKAGFVILPFFLVVAMLPAIELASPGEKPRETRASLLEQLDENSFFEKSGVSRQDIEKFLKSPGATLLSGHGFYPRFYSYEEGEPIMPDEMTPYTAREFPRLVFTLLLPRTDRPVVLPVERSRLYFPDAAEVIVAGCLVGDSTVFASYLNYIDAAFVVILDDPVTVHVRVPDAPLVCPLREPVCDNNHFCN